MRRPEYAVRVPLYPFAASKRDYSDIARRYTHLSISPDFVKLVFKWPQVSVVVVFESCCNTQSNKQTAMLGERHYKYLVKLVFKGRHVAVQGIHQQLLMVNNAICLVTVAFPCTLRRLSSTRRMLWAALS